MVVVEDHGFQRRIALRLLAENRPEVNVVALAAAREEISFAGAYAAAHALAPLAAIAVDVTHSTDYPEADKRRDADVKLGGGPVITRGSSTSATLTELLIEVARRDGMPFALQASPSKTYTDADAMIEAGNLRNPDDAQRMTSRAGRAGYVDAVERGIRTFLGR